MRPMYETKADLTIEESVKGLLEKEWCCDLVKLPIRYHLDFACSRNGRVIGFCEVKSRSYTMEAIDRMGGYLLSIGKWEAAKSLCDASGLAFLLVVRATDGLYYARFKDDFLPDDVLIRGRTDRDDWQDIEPCVLLDASKFKLIAKHEGGNV
jgi:hypothetical protein